MRGEDLVGNMRLMGLGDPPYPEDQFVAKVSTPPVPFIVRRAPAASTAQYSTSQQQIARQQLERARLDLQQRAQQQAQQQAAQQRYQQQAQQIAAANMAAKTILGAAKSTAASRKPAAGDWWKGMSTGARLPNPEYFGPTPTSTGPTMIWTQPRAPESQVESRGGYITAPAAGLPWAERDLVDISREADLSLAISRQAAIDKAHAAQQQAYEPTYIENPWVAKVFGGQSAPSGVSTQLPDVAGEIVELPDLPQAIPSAASTQQQAYRPIYTTQGRQQIEQEFNQKFGVPVEPMFNLFWLAKTREQWAKEYQLKYGERAPETAEEMRVALLRKGELDAKALGNAARIASESAAATAPYDARMATLAATNPAMYATVLAAQQTAAADPIVVLAPSKIEHGLLQRMRDDATRAQEAASKEKRLQEKKEARAAELKKRYDRDLLERQEAREREIANKETERIAAEYAEVERREKERLNRPLIELRRELMSQVEQDAFFCDMTLQQLDKARFMEDDYNLKYVDQVAEEATKDGVYRSELVPDIRRKYLNMSADTYDRIQAKKIAKGKITDTSKPPKFNVAQIASDEQISNAVRKGVLKRLSPHFVTSIDHLASKRDGKFYPGAEDEVLTDWVSGLIKEKGMSRSEIAKYAAKFIGIMMRDQGQSAIVHDYLAAGSTGIDSDERRKRLQKFARTINAANYAIADWQPHALSKQLKESPLGVLADVIIQESPNIKKAAWAALDNARNLLAQKAKEALVGRDILQRVEVASRIRDDRSKSITQKADELLAIRAITPDDAIAMKQGYLNYIDFAQAQAKGERMMAQSAADTKKVREQIASALEGEEDWGVLLPPPKGVIVQDPMAGSSIIYADQPSIEGGAPGSTMRGLRGFEWVS